MTVLRREDADLALAAPQFERLVAAMGLGEARGLDVVARLDLLEAHEPAARFGQPIEPVIGHFVPHLALLVPGKSIFCRTNGAETT